ncbi:MAG TPA: NUDIX hydrolase [Candidatus Saccharimonadales bacterium]
MKNTSAVQFVVWYDESYMNAWKTLSSEYVHENPWYKVRHDSVIRPNGTKGNYFVIESPKAAFTIAVTSDSKILLVSVHRYTTGHAGWEVPGGGFEAGDTALMAARRELQEESGYTANTWHDLGMVEIANGTTDGAGAVFVAKDLQPTGANAQDEEGIGECRAFTEKEVITMIESGKIVDAVSIAALMKYFIWRGTWKESKI